MSSRTCWLCAMSVFGAGALVATDAGVSLFFCVNSMLCILGLGID